MVKKVAAMFFKEVGDALLLKMKPSEWGKSVAWTSEEPADKKAPEDGSVLIHHLNDGCAHVFCREPLPMSVVLEALPMPLGDDGVHVFPDGV